MTSVATEGPITSIDAGEQGAVVVCGPQQAVQKQWAMEDSPQPPSLALCYLLLLVTERRDEGNEWALANAVTIGSPRDDVLGRHAWRRSYAQCEAKQPPKLAAMLDLPLVSIICDRI